MPKLNFSVDISDEQFEAFMERMAANAELDTAPAVAGATPAAAPIAGPGGVEVDKVGLPWIAAIHAPSKAKNADGSWRAKKGIDAATKASYEAQARQQGFVAPGIAPPAAAAPLAPPPPAAAAAFMQPQPVPGFPAMQPAPAFPPIQQPPADVPVSFEEVAAKFQAAVASGRMAADTFATWYPEMGINDPQQLATNETARKVAMKKLKEVMGEPA